MFSIPIIRLYGVLIVSIQTELSDTLVDRLKADVSDQIDKTHARGLILDVSGVDVMDSYITRVFRDLGQISLLMGVKTILCGLDPGIAMTLVEMDMDLPGIETAMNLEAAIERFRDNGEEENGR